MEFTTTSIHPDAQFVEIATVRSLVTASGAPFFNKENMRGKRASNCAMLLNGVYYFVVSITLVDGRREYVPYCYSIPLDFLAPHPSDAFATSKEAWQAIDAAIAALDIK